MQSGPATGPRTDAGLPRGSRARDRLAIRPGWLEATQREGGFGARELNPFSMGRRVGISRRLVKRILLQLYFYSD